MIPRLTAAAIARTRKSALLLGPRQTGKSTLVHSLSPELAFDFSDETTYLEFSANPALRAARSFPKRTRTLLVHLGAVERVIEGVPVLPWQVGLRELGL